MRLTAVNHIGQVCSHLCCEVNAVFPADVYALHENQHEGLQMHRKFSAWMINSEHASFELQLNAITLKKQARVCSPGGIRVWKTERRAQNRLMRYNSSLMAQGAGKPCLLQTLIQNLQRTASAPLQMRALRWNTARSCALKIYSYSISEVPSNQTRSRIHDLYPASVFLDPTAFWRGLFSSCALVAYDWG